MLSVLLAALTIPASKSVVFDPQLESLPQSQGWGYYNTSSLSSPFLFNNGFTDFSIFMAPVVGQNNVYRTDPVPPVGGDSRSNSDIRFWYRNDTTFDFDDGFVMEANIRDWDAGEGQTLQPGMGFIAVDNLGRMLGFSLSRTSFQGQAQIRLITGGNRGLHTPVFVPSTAGKVVLVVDRRIKLYFISSVGNEYRIQEYGDYGSLVGSRNELYFGDASYESGGWAEIQSVRVTSATP
jgi:hypothetical protein